MAAKKKASKKTKPPHCTVLRDAAGNPKKTSAGKNRKMCWKDGKLVSESVVKQARARMKARKAS